MRLPVTNQCTSIWSHCISYHDGACVDVTDFFSSFLTFPCSDFFPVPPEHLSPSALPLSTPPTPSQPLIRPLTAASPACSPHYIARCAFFAFLGENKRHISETPKISPWRAPRIKRPKRKTRPAGRTPSTTRGPGRCWVARPAAGVRVWSVSGCALTFTGLIPHLVSSSVRLPKNHRRVSCWVYSLHVSVCWLDGHDHAYWEWIVLGVPRPTWRCKGEAFTKRLPMLSGVHRSVFVRWWSVTTPELLHYCLSPVLAD